MEAYFLSFMSKSFAKLTLFIVLLLPLMSFISAGEISRFFSSDNISVGDSITVSLDITTNSSDLVYSIREKIPQGFIVTDAGTGTYLEDLHEIRWFQLGNPVDVVRQYSVQSINAGTFVFDGYYVFNAELILRQIGGETTVNVHDVFLTNSCLGEVISEIANEGGLGEYFSIRGIIKSEDRNNDGKINGKDVAFIFDIIRETCSWPL
jgi:hypothetical protein